MDDLMNDQLEAEQLAQQTNNFERSLTQRHPNIHLVCNLTENQIKILDASVFNWKVVYLLDELDQLLQSSWVDFNQIKCEVDKFKNDEEEYNLEWE